MRLPCPCHLLILLSGLSTQALAQQPAQNRAPQKVEVKGTAASYDPRRDDTAARLVVKREEIARYGDATVADILNRVPGVTVSTGSGRSTEVRMRGLGSGYTQILVNGERTPSGFALDTLAPDLIERIEVLRVASAEFSTQAVAGTINIVLRKKVQKRQREAKLGYLLSGDFRGPSFSTQVAERGEKSSWSVSASGNHDSLAREWRGIEENTRPDGVVDMRRLTVGPEAGRMNRLNLAPRLNWTLDNGDTLAWENTFTGSSFRNHGHPVVTTFSGRAPQTPDLQTFGEFDDRMARSDLHWNRSLPSGVKLDMKIGAEWSSRKMFVRRAGLDSAGRPETDGHTLSDGYIRGANTTGKATRAVSGGHLLALGWDLRVNSSSDIRTERDRVRALPPAFLLDEDFRTSISRAALYVQDEWTVDPRWSLYMGTRWEGVRTRFSGNSVDAARVQSSVLSPILQSLYKLPGEQGRQVRLAVSRTYKAPGLEALVPRRAAWENNSPTEADYRGNPRLRPELAWGIDAAYEHYWAEGALVSVSGAVKRIDDHTGSDVYFDGLRWIYTPVNAGRATLRSIDIETKFPLKALFAGAPAIDLRASVSRNWSRVDAVAGPHNRIERQVPLTANLGIDYKRGALASGASLAHRRGGYMQVAANRGFYREARTALDTYAVWTFDPGIALRVALSNLLGEANVFEPSYFDPVTGLEKRRWIYPSSASLRATLELKF